MTQTKQAAEFLTSHQVVQRWGGAVTVGTLANWRSQRTGPAYNKMGGRVLYPIAQLLAWEAQNMRAANDNNAGGAE